MSIIPRGKTLIMKAQAIEDPLHQQDIFDDIDIDNIPEPEVIPEQEAVQEQEVIPEQESVETVQPQEKQHTLENYIFNKLESFGWPGRLLQDYKDKFSSKSLSADGVEEVKIEILDRKYPNMDQIDKKDIKIIIKEISNQFGLYFSGGDNNDGRWSLRFTSEHEVEEEQDQTEMGAVNYLDKIYGNPKKSGLSPDKKALTLKEMIKIGKDEIIKLIKKNKKKLK